MKSNRNLKILLIAVALLQFGFPITTYGRAWSGVYILTHVLMVLFGVLVVRGSLTHMKPILVLAACVLIGGGWFTLAPDSEAATLSINVPTGLFMVAVIHFLLRFIFQRRSRPVGQEIILAAIIVYVMMGGVFKSVFVTLEILQPGSFVDSTFPDEPMTWQQLLYFSYVTLATLGYGDIVPVTVWARTFATVETIAGPLYLATIVARLVGAYSGPGEPTDRPGRTDRPNRPDPPSRPE